MIAPCHIVKMIKAQKTVSLKENLSIGGEKNNPLLKGWSYNEHHDPQALSGELICTGFEYAT
jgi:hypothetical protein